MKILQLLRRKHESEQQQRDDNEIQLWAELRQLLERGDDATDREAERVATIADELSITLPHVEVLSIALEEYAELQAREEERPELEKSIETTQKKIDAVKLKIEELKIELNRHIADRTAAQSRLEAVESAEHDAKRFESFFPELIIGERFGPKLVASEEHLTAPSNRVSQAARSRGITLEVKYDEAAEQKRREEARQRIKEREQHSHEAATGLHVRHMR